MIELKHTQLTYKKHMYVPSATYESREQAVINTRELISVIDFHTFPLNLEVVNAMRSKQYDCSLDNGARANNIAVITLPM